MCQINIVCPPPPPLDYDWWSLPWDTPPPFWMTHHGPPTLEKVTHHGPPPPPLVPFGPFRLVCLMKYYCVYNDNMSLNIDTSRLMIFFIVKLHDLVYYECTVIVNN